MKQIRRFPAKLYKKVTLDQIRTEYVVLGEELIHIYRSPFGKTSEIINDAIGAGWVFLTMSPKSGKVAVKLGCGRSVELSGNLSIFLPSFSVIEWHISKGPYEVEMVTGMATVPAAFPSSPIAWAEPNGGDIFDKLERFFMAPDSIRGFSIDRGSNACSLSRRAKNHITNDFNESICMADLAKSLNTSSGVLSRYFKTSYGFSPLKYLNRLRIADSLRILLLNESSVLETSGQVGFSLTRQYYEHFSKYLDAPPSYFLNGANRVQAEPTHLTFS